METRSEKRTKDTLNRLLHDGEILYFQKVTTPRYQPEPIDFLVVGKDGRSHLVEVKENGSSQSIAQGQFKDHQLEVLTRPELNKEDAHTRAWVVVRIFDGDRNKSHKNFYDWYFIVPGTWASDDELIELNRCRQEEDAILLGKYEYGQYRKMDEEYGRTTKGNDVIGFEKIGVIH